MTFNQNPENNRLLSEKSAGLLELQSMIELNIPQGLFLVDVHQHTVSMNDHLRSLLHVPLDVTRQIPLTDFVDYLVVRSDSPEITRAEITKILNNKSINQTIYFSLRGLADRYYKLTLYEIESDRDYLGGMVVNRSDDQLNLDRRIKILEELCQDSRKLSASTVGNLDALSENIHSWNADFVDSFIHDSKDQIKELSTKLDLALNYLGLLSDQEIFPQTVNIKNFLGEIIEDYSKLDLHLMNSGGQDTEDIPIHLDPALSRKAIYYLLDEVALYSLGDHPVDILIEKDQQAVSLIIQSGPTLPLPGLSPSDDKSSEITTNPMVHLAESIIKLQGGFVQVENYPAERGTGLRVLISLPLVNIAENNIPIRILNPVEEKFSGRVLLAESQTEYQLTIQESLVALGFRVDLATEGNAALDMVQRINPVVVIVARNLPGLDGILLTQGIRRWSAVPIIMISSRTDTEDLLRAFQAGVDDYLKKPFRMDEFQLRLKANLARSESADQRVVPEIYHSGDIRIDYSSRLVWQRGNLVHLTPIEYRLLVYMTRQGKQIMTYEQLLNQVWEGPEKGSRQGLFVHIRRLREKIESDPEDPQIILNKWGVGYEFNP